MEAESLMAKISVGECTAFHETDIFRIFCLEFVKLEEKQNDLQTNLYITAGVLGGVCLLLLIFITILFVKLNNGFNHLHDGDMLQKRGFSTYTGRPTESMNPAFAPSPQPFPAGGGGTFDNATAGGVRVLPRNPPTFRNNSPNEKYY